MLQNNSTLEQVHYARIDRCSIFKRSPHYHPRSQTNSFNGPPHLVT